MRRQGVTPGTLLFNGTRSGRTISGTARLFASRCRTLSYAVSGRISQDGRTVVISGTAPRRNLRSCRLTGSKWDRLVFSLY